MTLKPLVFILFSIFYFLFSQSAEAAVLYLEPDSGQYNLEDVFVIDINLDTEGKDINVIKANINFSQNILEVKDFSKGNSILSLWAEEPNFSNQNGKISFSGGIPGGYQEKDGFLGKIVFKAKSGGEAILEIKEDSQVLLNDGFGTPAALTTKGGVFTILPEKSEISKDEWRKELEKDKTPPEFFEIKLGKDPAVFEGKYFIAFFTTDAGSGIDYYEIKEGDRNWKAGKSPYLLEDQSLKSKILVKAVDKAGNERIVEYFPAKKPFPWRIVIGIVVGLVIIGWIVKKFLIPKS